MNTDPVERNAINPIQLVVAAPDFQSGLSFFVDELGFEVEMIAPAEDPNIAILALGDFTVSLDKHSKCSPVTLEVFAEETELEGTCIQGPNGTKINYVTRTKKIISEPRPDPIFTTAKQVNSQWVTGRADMAYRSLIEVPNSGVTASHIRIEGSGEVPDWVHYHDVGFQIIYCLQGSAKLVYEGQGDPFMFEEGDCVLQPPHIRHRVLESFDNLEVIEFSSPSDHATYADRAMSLPNKMFAPTQEFSGQRFALSRQSESQWTPYMGNSSLRIRETSIADASGGTGWVTIIEATGTNDTNESSLNPLITEDNPEFLLWFVLQGTGTVTHHKKEINLERTDAMVCPYGYSNETEFALTDFDEGFKVLEIGLNNL